MHNKCRRIKRRFHNLVVGDVNNFANKKKLINNFNDNAEKGQILILFNPKIKMERNFGLLPRRFETFTANWTISIATPAFILSLWAKLPWWHKQPSTSNTWRLTVIFFQKGMDFCLAWHCNCQSWHTEGFEIRGHVHLELRQLFQTVLRSSS